MKYLALWFLEIGLLIASSKGFAVSSPGVVRIQPVQTVEDWNALANVRFDEWIQEGHGTSRQAFQAATKDLYMEERPRSVLLLAKRQSDGAVVGAAEMSPHELEQALSQDAPFSALYVTDVVTSSQCRRQGIARTMMKKLEEYAAILGAAYLVLNVAYANTAAVEFYGTLGYRVPTPDLLAYLDRAKLEEAAGTKGQILLMKRLVDDEFGVY